MYDIEVIWNREFDWRRYASKPTMEEAIGLARAMQEMGDGASVKETRVIKDHDKVVWQNGRMV
jgi:methyl coenzyme M reductase subunit C-like uncharacterized protein (methanogenesis marker protein 7)